MSQKRKHGDSTGDSETRHFSKKSRGDFKPSHPHNKSKRPHKSSRTPDPSKTGTSNAALKNRIRDLRRLLDHADTDPTSKIPANVRIDRERELEACEHELTEKRAAWKEAEVRRKMIGKYHQVRFFDRQKATRILKRLRRELASLSDPSKAPALEERIHVAEVDLNYALYYPLMKAYSALFPRKKGQQEEAGSGSGGDAGDEGRKVKGDPEMWRKVEAAMSKGEEALEELRNWKPQREVVEKKEVKKGKEDKKKDAGKARHEEKEKSAQEDEDEESDGGFFE